MLIASFQVPHHDLCIPVFDHDGLFIVMDPDGSIVTRTVNDAEALRLAEDYALHYFDIEDEIDWINWDGLMGA
jgi:hypothetical protein